MLTLPQKVPSSSDQVVRLQDLEMLLILNLPSLDQVVSTQPSLVVLSALVSRDLSSLEVLPKVDSEPVSEVAPKSSSTVVLTTTQLMPLDSPQPFRDQISLLEILLVTSLEEILLLLSHSPPPLSDPTVTESQLLLPHTSMSLRKDHTLLMPPQPRLSLTSRRDRSHSTPLRPELILSTHQEL